jgi:hypothetical protein
MGPRERTLERRGGVDRSHRRVRCRHQPYPRWTRIEEGVLVLNIVLSVVVVVLIDKLFLL